MPAPLLKTKLYIPPARSGLVSRSRLVERLKRELGPDHKLTLVSAPAGFGKTTLLAEWIHSMLEVSGSLLPAHCFCWLSLDKEDNDPVRFLSYLIAALQTIRADVGQEALIMLRSPQPPLPEHVLTLLINEIAVSGESRSVLEPKWVVVLDDYHLITAERVHEAMTFLLDHLPPSMHLILLTRADPPLPLARMRARSQLVEIRVNDLRFTTPEVEAFLNQVMDLGLAAADVAAMENRTEGWVAGLQLAALALRPVRSAPDPDDVHQFVSAFTGSHHYIVDYLSAEVLDRQPEPVKSFLLQTSVLDRLNGLLCNALTGREDAQVMLEALQQGNLFVVPLDEERCWYRYHRLFADLLRSRLQQVQPELIPGLLQRASKWYEQQGDADAAIGYALEAKDFSRAADLIEREAEGTLMRGRVFTLVQWLDALPDDLVRQRSSLCVWHAWALLFSGGALKTIESRLRDIKGADDVAPGMMAALHALLLAFQGKSLLATDLSRQALALSSTGGSFMHSFAGWVQGVIGLDSGDKQAGMEALDRAFTTSRQAGNVTIAAFVSYAWAELHVREGRLYQAAEAYRRVLDLATDAHGRRLPIAGPALVGLGELSREWNDLDAATRHVTEGMALSAAWVPNGDYEAYIVLARIRMARGDVAGAQEALQRAQEAAARYDVTELDDMAVALFQARMWVARGDLDAARRWAEGLGLYQYLDTPLREEIREPTEHRMLKYELLVLARLLVAEGKYDGAWALLESLIPVAEQRQRPRILIEVYVLQALALDAQGHRERALCTLERALSLAEPGGYTRIFLDEGLPVAQLLDEAVCRDTASAYARRLRSAFAADVPPGSGPAADSHGAVVPLTQLLIEPLTERELEILRLLPSYLSSTEIARELYISANTVRSHIKSIYDKLDVHNRADAVERARELHLL